MENQSWRIHMRIRAIAFKNESRSTKRTVLALSAARVLIFSGREVVLTRQAGRPSWPCR